MPRDEPRWVGTVILAGLLAALAGNVARAQPSPGPVTAPGASPAATLRAAATSIEAGDYERASILALSVLQAHSDTVGSRAAVDVHDRAEAWRIYGLSLFFLDRRERAELAFVEWIKLEYEGRLDPALIPPEAIVFFEDVRSRHAAELRAYRPRPPRSRVWALNLLPPGGQLQNRQPVKGWLIAGTGALLLGTNITTYLVLDDWCDNQTGLCISDQVSHTDSARLLRSVNIASGIGFIGVVAYGIIDGFHGFYSQGRARSPAGPSASIGVYPDAGGALVVVEGRF